MYNRQKILWRLLALLVLWGGLQFLCVADSNIQLKSQWNESAVEEIFISGNKAFLGCKNKLVILDISDKTNPVKLGEMAFSETVVSVFASGDFVYVADSPGTIFEHAHGNSYLRIIDISNPSKPKEVSSYSSSIYERDLSIRSVVVSGKYAYVGTIHREVEDAAQGSIDILDISNPESPQLISRFIKSNTGVSTVCLSGNYLYCGISGDSLADPPIYTGLAIIDVSTPESPGWVDSFTFSGYTRTINQFYVSGNHVYYTLSEFVFDGYFNRIEILNTSDPYEIKREWLYETNGTAEDIFISGEFAYIADGEAGLRVFHMAKPRNYQEVAFYKTTGSATRVELDENFVYVLDDDIGLLILKITPEVFTQPQITMDKTQLYFGATQGGTAVTPSQTVSIVNNSVGTINWTASTGKNWLKATPQSGSGDSTIKIEVSPGILSVGTYTDTVTISDTNASNSPQQIHVTFEIYAPQSVISPWGSFETPEDNSTVMSSIPVTGWALHQIGIDSVKIYRAPLKGEGNNLIYIGEATFVEGARPDVEISYPGFPMNSKAGWGYMMLTNFLPNSGNGTFTLYAVATAATGEQITLGTKTIVCDNTNADRPFGALDTPAQGGYASGNNYINWGWVLTPQPKSILTDGSNIAVSVDGWMAGHPVYNLYRPDIANIFPGYANSLGAGGYCVLDTTLYTNGVHTIQWLAWDDSRKSGGIGSRYFSIQNSETSTDKKSRNTVHYSNHYNPVYSAKDLPYFPVRYNSSINVEKGYSQDGMVEEKYPDENGIVTIESPELERIKISLSGEEVHLPLLSLSPERGNNFESENYSGYLVVGNQLRSLPIGSFLDRVNGIFCWGPGPGFVGLYEFIFLDHKNQCKYNININIKPKHSH